MAWWMSSFISYSWIQLIPCVPFPTVPPRPSWTILFSLTSAPPFFPITKLVLKRTSLIPLGKDCISASSQAFPTNGARPYPVLELSVHRIVGGSPKMWAVDICTQTLGGLLISFKAFPIILVDSTLERKIKSQFSGVLMHSTVLSVRLIIVCAFSSVCIQSPVLTAC